MTPDTAMIPNAIPMVLPPELSVKIWYFEVGLLLCAFGYLPWLFLSDKKITLYRRTVKWEFCIIGIINTNIRKIS